MRGVAAKWIVAVLLALGLCPPAGAADIAPVADDEIAGLFAAFCLAAFPAAAPEEEAAKRRHAAAMTPAELARFLHGDPGRGWFLRTGAALYAVTIEAPPWRACAVRRMTPSGLAGATHYIAAVERHAARRHEKLVQVPPKRETSPDGADIVAYGYGVLDESRRPKVRIPTEAGRVFRRDAGQRSDLKPATVPN
jgi:hypothetical protein